MLLLQRQRTDTHHPALSHLPHLPNLPHPLHLLSPAP